MKIAIGSDHAGVGLKTRIKNAFNDINFVDVGTNTEESCDYPDYISLVAREILSGNVERGIAICGTGVGASIVANKFPGIRAALCTNCYMAEMSRRHNDSNVLVLGARILGDDFAIRIIQTWLSTPFEGGKHQRRLGKISNIEQSLRK